VLTSSPQVGGIRLATALHHINRKHQRSHARPNKKVDAPSDCLGAPGRPNERRVREDDGRVDGCGADGLCSEGGRECKEGREEHHLGR